MSLANETVRELVSLSLRANDLGEGFLFCFFVSFSFFFLFLPFVFFVALLL
jgi:hypothetical protein